jgi:hypothetical protein
MRVQVLLLTTYINIFFIFFMNTFLNFIRYNYIYSFSFKNFGSKNSSSIRNMKGLSLYLAAGTKNSDISVRSSIKHEFKLSESQKLNVSNFAIIPSRKDDEFGRPYFKPLIFKYNYYWDNYAKKSTFFNDIVNTYFFSNFDIFPNVSSDVCSFLDFKFFRKHSYKRKIRRRNFKFKKKFKKRNVFMPFFNFRANGFFFVYKPVSFSFFFNRNLFDFAKFNKNLFSFLLKQKTKGFFINKFRFFFYSENRFSKLYKKKIFESSKIFSYTFFKRKMIGRRFKKYFKSFLKVVTDDRYTKPYLRKVRFKYSKALSFKFFYNRFTNFRNLSFFYKIKKKISSSLFFNIFKKNYSNSFSVFFNFFSLIFKTKKFKNNYFFFLKNKFKFVFKFLRRYFKLFKIRKVRFSYFVYSIYFFNFFYKTYVNRINFSDINIFKIYFSNLITLNKFFIHFSNVNSYRNTFFFSMIFSVFFRSKNIKINFNKFTFDTKLIKVNFKNEHYNYFYFSDFYKSFFNTYNILSSNRYNDIIKLYKNIFNPNFYAYRVSSSRKIGKRSIFSVRKISNFSKVFF